MSESLRLFTALELPQGARSALAAWGIAAAGLDPALRALPANALHATLHFLGERPAHEVDGLRSAVGAARPDGLELHGTGVLWLAPRRPHVLACGLSEHTGALNALHEALGAALAGACEGWLPDQRALRPHVTVARVRRGARPAVASVPPAPELRFSPPALVLMRSRLGPGGARYEALERRPLLSLS